MVGVTANAQALGPLESPIEHNLSRLAVYRRVKAAHAVRYAEAFGALPESEVLVGVPMNASPRSDEAGQRAWAQLPVGERRVVEQVFVHVGKALEAYQRQLKPGETPVDRYVAALNAGDRLGGGALSPSAVLRDELVRGEGEVFDVPQAAPCSRIIASTTSAAQPARDCALRHRAQGPDRDRRADRVEHQRLRS